MEGSLCSYNAVSLIAVFTCALSKQIPACVAITWCYLHKIYFYIKCSDTEHAEALIFLVQQLLGLSEELGAGHGGSRQLQANT